MECTETLTIVPEKISTQSGVHSHACKLIRSEKGQASSQLTLWFKYPSSVTALSDNDCDSFVLAVIMDAMQENRKLVIKGEVSRALLSNLIEYQLAWHKWLPEQYHVIDIEVSTVKEATSLPVKGTVSAFSGGVDATFTVWQHVKKKMSYGSADITCCAFVHGFDIPLTNEADFQKALLKSSHTLADLKLSIMPLASNFRQVTKVPWEHCFASALVAALSNLKNMAGHCLIGSSEPYDYMIVPWGSNPVTDHLLGSDSFEVRHDGAAFNRSEKVAVISDWQVGVDSLRVCWEGAAKEKNCGICEKCVRTQFNFLTSGKEIPNSFPKIDIVNALQNIELSNKAMQNEWLSLLSMAKKYKQAPWYKPLKKFVHKRPINQIFFPLESERRAYVKELIQRFKQKIITLLK